ncbi:MAG: hypothetical protein Q4G44_06470 [Alcaligenaceae bacterium]|nr:hypothetical protein [Alcaligenaceae bacterium]
MIMDRRSFLNIHNSSSDEAWAMFCTRLRRFAHGTWETLPDSDDGFPQARLQLQREHEFEHARALAEEYDIALVLDGTMRLGRLTGRPGLWVKHSQKLSEVDYFSEEACLAQAGTLVSTLAQQGYEQFRGVPPLLTLAQWFADPQYHDVRPGLSFLSGVERIQVLFANGETAVVGGFGVDDTTPLNVPILHKAIPQLFELLQNNTVQEALNSESWLHAYRLEALHKKLVEPNIARVFQGHRGSLVWVQSLVIRKIPKVERLLLNPEQWRESYGKGACGGEVDNEIKSLFDPAGLYPYLDELFKPF